MVSVLFSREFFGIVMTLTGCEVFTGGKFSVFRAVLAALLTLGGIALTLRSSRKWLLVLHVLAWAAALALPRLPKPVGNLFTILCAAALIPFVLNVIRLIFRKLAGIGESEPPDGERGK